MIFLLISLLILGAAPIFIATGGSDGSGPSSRENMPPMVNITSPETESEAKDTITISGTASDDVNVTHVKLLIWEVHYNATDTSGNGTWATWNYTLDTTKYENGELKVTAFSSDGELAADDFIWLVINNTDEVMPKIWIGSPANNTEISGTGRIAGHATDNNKIAWVDIVMAEKEWDVVDTSGNHTWYKWVLEFDSTKLENGEYWVTARASDGTNIAKTKILIIINNTVVKENHWPFVEITHPASEATVSGTITVKGKAWDPDGNVTLVQVILNHVFYNATDKSGNGTWYYWEYVLNTSLYEDGEFNIGALATDDGNKKGDNGRWVIIKNTKENMLPHIEINHPANEATVSGVIEIKGKAWDTDGKVVKVKVRIFEVWYNATDTSGNGSWYTWKLEYNTSKLKDGEYKVTAIAYDDKEKLEDIGIWIIVKNHKENLAPHIEITHPASEATVSGVIVIKGKAWDTDGKIVLVKVRIGEHLLKATDTSGNGSWYTWSLEFNTTKLKNGEHKIGAIAWDDKEKAEDTHRWIIVKNPVHEEKPNKAPYVYLTHPKHHSSVKGVIVIKGNAWDLDGNVTKVKVRIYERWHEAKDTSGNGSWYTWSLEFNTSKLENGWVKITAAAYDGKAWGDDYIYLQINNPVNKCPKIAITHPKAHSEVSGNVVISGEASDDTLVKYVQVRIGDHKFNTTDTSGNNSWAKWKFIWNTSGYENGEYRIGGIVYDGLCYEDTSVVVFLNNTKKDSSSNESSSESESENDQSSETDSESTDKNTDSEDNKDEKKSSPLPGFDGPMTFVAAAIAAVVVGFFRKHGGSDRTK
jgi:ribosomal protein S28E/S33